MSLPFISGPLFGAGSAPGFSSSSKTGDTAQQTDTAQTVYSPFAVGRGASAEASGTAPAQSNALVYVALGVALVAVFLAARKS